MKSLTVAIVGVGFGGLVCASELVRRTEGPLNLLLFDDSNVSGKGIAYSTTCPWHLLNVPAGKMGAPSEAPGDFVAWLMANPQKWRALDPSFAELQVNGKAYLPRMLFAEYLQERRRALIEDAKKKNVQITWIDEKVEDATRIDQRYELRTSSGEKLTVDVAVLSISSPWTQSIPHSESSHYLSVPWPSMTDKQMATKILSELSGKASVGVIGSGLTMLDVVATLKECGFGGNVTVLSRRALIPQAHNEESASVNLSQVDLPDHILPLFGHIKMLCRMHPWRSVIDALRPMTTSLWQRLSVGNKKVFLRRLLSLWNSHRHRAPAEIRNIVVELQGQGRLKFVKGDVIRVDADADKAIAVFKDPQQQPEVFDLLINCSGPNYAIHKHSSLLIQNLLAKGYVRPDELGLGLAQEESGIYPIGSLLFGSLFETTAVPEIREQCCNVAEAILKKANSIGL